MISFDVVLIRVKNTENYIKSMTNNFISKGYRVQKQIKELASSYKKIDKNLYIKVYKEFRDGFFSHTILNSNEGILLYTLTLQ